VSQHVAGRHLQCPDQRGKVWQATGELHLDTEPAQIQHDVGAAAVHKKDAQRNQLGACPPFALFLSDLFFGHANPAFASAYPIIPATIR